MYLHMYVCMYVYVHRVCNQTIVYSNAQVSDIAI